MRERCHHANRAMTAHSEIPDIVEKDYPELAGRMFGFAEQRTDRRIRPARLIHDGRAKGVELGPPPLAPFVHASQSQVRTAAHDQPSWFPTGMRIDDVNAHDAPFASWHASRDALKEGRENISAPKSQRPEAIRLGCAVSY